MQPEKRVYLSSLENDHIDRFISLFDDPELVATMGWRPFAANDRERFLQWFQILTLPYLDTGRTMIFSIICADDHRAIGFLSIKGIRGTQASAEVGIAIMEKEYRGEGYGTEALMQAVDYAFEELGLNLLGLTVFPSNQRAIRAYEKVGFRKKELLKDSWILPSGEHSDMWLMELARNELT